MVRVSFRTGYADRVSESRVVSHQTYRRVLAGGAGSTLLLVVLTLPFSMDVWQAGFKKHGFGEYPRQPGEKTPSELLAEAERIKAQK